MISLSKKECTTIQGRNSKICLGKFLEPQYEPESKAAIWCSTMDIVKAFSSITCFHMEWCPICLELTGTGWMHSFLAFPLLLPWPTGQGASSWEVLPTRVIPAGVSSHGEPGLLLAAKRTAWALLPTGHIQTAQRTQMGFHRKTAQLNFRSNRNFVFALSRQASWIF